MAARRTVALLIETSNAYARGLMDGVIAYQREHELWSIYVGEQERGARPPRWLKNWRGDGIIARIETEPIAAALGKTQPQSAVMSSASAAGSGRNATTSLIAMRPQGFSTRNASR